MSNNSYDRDVYSGSSFGGGSNWGASNISSAKLSSSTLDSLLNPKNKILRSKSKHPIIIMLDVTGSNINFARIVYDKMPMLYTQIEEKKYFDDFEISVCAVGDATSDKYPLQIADFAKGIEIDTWMEKLVLEGNGGGQEKESYQLAAHYLAKKTEFGPNSKPIVFFIGDEEPYPEVSKDEAKEFEIPYSEPTNGFSELRRVVNDNVYMFLNKYSGSEYRPGFVKTWSKLLAPEHVIKIEEEKAIVDQMLGTIAIIAGKNLQTYALDMKNRGQSQKRIEEVTKLLSNLATALVPIEQVNTDLPVEHSMQKTYGNIGRRL